MSRSIDSPRYKKRIAFQQEPLEAYFSRKKHCPFVCPSFRNESINYVFQRVFPFVVILMLRKDATFPHEVIRVLRSFITERANNRNKQPSLNKIEYSPVASCFQTNVSCVLWHASGIERMRDTWCSSNRLHKTSFFQATNGRSKYSRCSHYQYVKPAHPQLAPCTA